MKLNKTALALLLIPISLSSLAVTDVQLTGAFKTIKDVTISQVAGHEMVINGLQMTSGNSCSITTPAIANNWAGDILMKVSPDATSPSAPETGAAAYGAIPGGGGCSAGTGVPGIYEIDGSPGAEVTISLSGVTENGIIFVPVGCASDYDNQSDGDLCTPITVGGVNKISLANTGDLTNSSGNGTPIMGISRLLLAGSVTSNIGLSAGAIIPVSFDISVVY